MHSAAMLLAQAGGNHPAEMGSSDALFAATGQDVADYDYRSAA